MILTLQTFVKRWNGRPADFDGHYGPQCVDIVQYYNRDMFNGPFLVGNTAVDIWNNPPNIYNKVVNTPSNWPLAGDIIFFDFNHVAIVILADINSLTTFDQNYPTGSYCHFQEHDYISGLGKALGWLTHK